MKQTILNKIWVVTFFSSFITCNVLATEIVTTPTQQENLGNDNAQSFGLHSVIPKNFSEDLKKEINSSIMSPSVPSYITPTDNLPISPIVQKSVDESLGIKEEKKFFPSYINATVNNTQNFISKGVDFFMPGNQGKEDSLIGQYKKTKDIILDQGMKYIGIKYNWGGTSEQTGFDCSGLVKAVFQNSIGMTLPRTAIEMSKVGQKIPSMDSLKPGDLVFFNTMKRNFSHVGIYVGDNKFLHSPRKGATVRVEEIGASYWKKRFNGATRIEVNQSNIPNIR